MATCDKETSCTQCDSAEQCNQDEQQQHQEERLQVQLQQIKHTIIVMSGKGGVGKSTVATNLAITLAQREHIVGLLDADLHGPNVPKMLGMDGARLIASEQGPRPAMYYPNLKVASVAFMLDSPDDAVVWRGPLKHAVIRQLLSDLHWGALDFLIVDLPPGTGDEPLSVAQTIPHADGAIIVTTPQDVALLDARKSVTFARMLNLPVQGIVENMSGFICPHCGQRTDIFKTGGGEQAAAELGVRFLGRIPLEPGVVTLCDDGKPYVEKFPDSEMAQAFTQIANQCEQW
jgi:ATP-binding protein involved in chromosome partitioning